MSEITYEPAGDPEEVGVGEHVPATVTQKSLNADILRMLERPGKIWWGVFLLDLLILAIGGIAERNQIVRGIGVAGHTRPVMWATYVANFVFWVSIAPAARW
jgi:molybdopterin-containing oxidoreductase family membrane subunit